MSNMYSESPWSQSYDHFIFIHFEKNMCCLSLFIKNTTSLETIVTDVNQTYCGDHFSIYTNTKSVTSVPEAKILCQLYLNRKMKM